jgi:hypothetical protein
MHRAEAGSTQTDANVPVRRFPNGTETLFLRWYDGEAHRSLQSVLHYPAYNCIRRTIIAMKRFAEARNLTVSIQIAPTKEEVYSWLLDGAAPWSTTDRTSGFALAIRQLCRQEQIPFLDLKPFLVAASERVYRESGGQLYWPDDIHWSVEGNREVANVAYRSSTILRSSKPFDLPHK